MLATIDPSVANAWLALGTAVVGAVVWVWREAIASRIATARRVSKGLRHMVENFPEVMKDVRYLKHEAEYNGGATSKDMTRRLVHTVEYLLTEAQTSTFTSNDKGLIVAVSDRAAERLQCQKIDLLGNRWKSFLHPEDADKITRVWADIVADGRDARIPSVRLEAHYGVAHVDIDVIALRGNDDAFTGHIGFVRKSILR